MTTTSLEWIWLNDQDVCSAHHVIEASGLSVDEFDELVQVGVITPVENNAQFYRLSHIVTANTARRLRDDFELDLHGLALAMTLMRRIDDLQRELSSNRAWIPDQIKF